MLECRQAPVRLALAFMLFFTVSSLSGCGFHPRGSVTRLTELGSIYLDTSRNLSIAESVREALIDAAFTLAPNRDEAGVLLRLTGEEQNERVVSVNSTGRVSELELSHAVSMLIAETEDGESTSESQSQAFNRVEVIREYTYDETGVLGKENEARILRAEMEDELVRQIVLRTIARLAPSSVTALSIDNASGNLASLDRFDIGDKLFH